MAEEDVTKLPLNERLSHSNWKARLSAFNELATYQPADLTSRAEDLKQALKESNVACLDAVLSLWMIYAKTTQATKARNTVMNTICEKTIANPKTSIRQKGLEIILNLIEMDEPQYYIDKLLETAKTAKPKNNSYALIALTAVVNSYGVPTCQPKSIIQALPSLFASSDPLVRNETSSLALAIYTWIGESLMPFLKDIKSVQLKDFTSEIQKLPNDRPTQTRFLHSQKGKQAALEEQADVPLYKQAEEEPAPAEITAFDLSEPVDVLPLITNDVLSPLDSSKWKERKEALEKIQQITNVIKIQPDSFGPLVHTLGKKLGDTNLFCSQIAATCIENLAKGLHTNFATYRPQVANPLFEKLSEKKKPILDSMKAALDAVWKSSPSLPIWIDDFTTFAANKNPATRAELWAFVSRCMADLADRKQKLSPKDCKPLTQLAIKCVNEDATEAARDSGAETLAYISFLSGKTDWLEKVESVRVTKVKEKLDALNGSTSKIESSKINNQASETNSAPSATMQQSRKVLGSGNSGTLKSSKTITKTGGSTSSLNTKPKSTKPAKPTSTVQPISFHHTESSASEAFSGIVGDGKVKELSDSAWKVRLAAIDDMTPLLTSADPEMVIRALSALPVWNDNNFQVVGRVHAILLTLGESADFTNGCAQLGTPGVAEKLGDAKAKASAAKVLEKWAECTGFGFILSNCYTTFEAQKSPKIFADCISWIASSLSEFGLAGVDITGLIKFLKGGLANSNAAVRSASVQTFGVLRVLLGPAVRDFLNDQTPAVLTTVDAEFNRVKDQKPPSTFRSTRNKPKETKQAHVDQPEEEVAEPTLEDLLPRTNISADITSEILEMLTDANWKIRKEGLEKIEGIIASANRRIESDVGDLLPALKARLADANKNIQAQTLMIISSIAEAVPKSEFDRQAKIILSDIIKIATDSKPQVRATSIKCLDSLSFQVQSSTTVDAVSEALAMENANLRVELLKWIAERAPKPKPKLDCVLLIAPTAKCLGDKNAEVRKMAQAAIIAFSSVLGSEKVIKTCKGPLQDAIAPFLDQIKTAGSIMKPIAGDSKVRLAEAPTKSNASPAARVEPAAAAAKKTVPIAAVKANSTSSINVPVSSNNPPITLNDSKGREKRSDQDRGHLKWTFEAPRADLNEFLREQMEIHFSSEIIKQLFSEGNHKEKEFVAALASIEEMITSSDDVCLSKFEITAEEAQTRVAQNADSILRYITIRFFDTSTTIFMKTLDVLEVLFRLLDSRSYHLSEYEAAAFIPFFVNKVGDPKEAMRARVRALMKSICRIYPASKMFNYVLEGAKSKNVRTRTECLDETGVLIQRNGLGVCQPAKSLPQIAALASDRDAGVRNAALGTIVIAYTIVGDQIYKYLGKMGDKERSMLDEKIKRAQIQIPIPISEQRNIPAAKESLIAEKPISSASLTHAEVSQEEALSNSHKQFSLDIDHLDLPKRSSAPTVHASEYQLPSRQSRPQSTVTSKAMIIDTIMMQITSSDTNQSIDGLKHLERVMSDQPELVIAQFDALISTITIQVKLAFKEPLANSDNGSLLRLTKHLVNALVQLFSRKDFASNINSETLKPLLHELIQRLLDAETTEAMYGVQLARALNVLMLRVLDNDEMTTTLSVLISILEASALTLQTGQDKSVDTKYAELTLKCLWKVIKNIPQALKNYRLDVKFLLMECHKFFTTIRPAEFKHRVQNKVALGDLPYRTIRSILHELVFAMGEEILNHVSLIKDKDPRDTYILVETILEQWKEKKGLIPKRSKSSQLADESTPKKQPLEEPHSPSNIVPSPVNATLIREQQPKRQMSGEDELNLILSRVRSKEDTKKGLVELYEFQERNPHLQHLVDDALAKTGTFFQGYISRGLLSIAEERKENVDTTRNIPSTQTEEQTQLQRPFTAPTGPAGYKEKLLRLQKQLGYTKTDAGVNVDSNINPYSSAAPLEPTLSIATREANPAVDDRSQTVQALKEKLARMKAIYASNSSITTTTANIL